MFHARAWLIIPLLALALLGGYFWWSEQPRSVETATSRMGPLVDLVYATGFVEAEHPVSVSARLTAPVTDVRVAEGEHVHKGQPLVILDDGDVRGTMAQAAAESRVAGLNEHRIVTLFSEGWVTRAARDQAVASADAARAAEQPGVRKTSAAIGIEEGLLGLRVPVKDARLARRRRLDWLRSAARGRAPGASPDRRSRCRGRGRRRTCSPAGANISASRRSSPASSSGKSSATSSSATSCFSPPRCRSRSSAEPFQAVPM